MSSQRQSKHTQTVRRSATENADHRRPKAAPRHVSAKGARQRLGDTPTSVLDRLSLAIPDPFLELLFANPWQLLIAVILAAQSTDRTINRVTPELFKRWPTPQSLAAAPAAEVEEIVKSTGFFRNKAKAIRNASAALVERFGGDVPRTMRDLLQVPGVARKTANVVLSTAFGIAEGIVTDTHAMRVAQRLELTREQVPEKIEEDLCRQFSRHSWTRLSHQFVLHGRYVCTARAPKCASCVLNEVCPSHQAEPVGEWKIRAEQEAAEMALRANGFHRPFAKDRPVDDRGSNQAPSMTDSAASARETSIPGDPAAVLGHSDQSPNVSR